jgi:hypothetical protein
LLRRKIGSDVEGTQGESISPADRKAKRQEQNGTRTSGGLFDLGSDASCFRE